MRELHSRDLGRLNKFTKSPPPLPSLICTWTVIFSPPSLLPSPYFFLHSTIFHSNLSCRRIFAADCALWMARVSSTPLFFHPACFFASPSSLPPSTPNLRKIKKMVEKLENDGKILEKEKNIEIINKEG